MKKYSFKEWVVFGVGIYLLGLQAYEYTVDDLELTWLSLVVFIISLLLIFAPKALVDTSKTIAQVLVEKIKGNSNKDAQ